MKTLKFSKWRPIFGALEKTKWRPEGHRHTRRHCRSSPDLAVKLSRWSAVGFVRRYTGAAFREERPALRLHKNHLERKQGSVLFHCQLHNGGGGGGASGTDWLISDSNGALSSVLRVDLFFRSLAANSFVGMIKGLAFFSNYLVQAGVVSLRSYCL